jgi:chromosome segregation ATPase
LVQSILLFLLGFLTATAIALLVSPAIWRRAVMLTRKRIEASVPLTMNEIQADKDHMRAEFAMSTRRLEMNIKSLRDKTSAQIIEINRNQDELKRLTGEQADRSRIISQLEAGASKLEADLQRAHDDLQRQGARLADADSALNRKALEIENLGRLYDEAALTSSSRQVELVARETEIEKLSGDIGNMRLQRKDSERRAREMASDVKAAQEELKLERRRAVELGRKVDRLMKTVADRDDKLERREADLARLKAASQPGGAARGDAAADQLKDRLITMTRENRKLRGEIDRLERSAPRRGKGEPDSGDLLREQISQLAAEVVNMTAILEGPSSPIPNLLTDGVKSSRGSGAKQIVSLADRIRALQKAAAK